MNAWRVMVIAATLGWTAAVAGCQPSAEPAASNPVVADDLAGGDDLGAIADSSSEDMGPALQDDGPAPPPDTPDPDAGPPPPDGPGGCVLCHTDEARLIALAPPGVEEEAPETGGG